MEMDNAQFTGSLVLGLSALLGAYYLTLRIRSELAGAEERRGRGASREELEALRSSVEELRSDLGAGRLAMETRSAEAFAGAHKLIRRNAEHIAALIAQCEMFERRLSEASQRIDRLGERIGRN
jgi:hypothetical protein